MLKLLAPLFFLCGVTLPAETPKSFKGDVAKVVQCMKNPTCAGWDRRSTPHAQHYEVFFTKGSDRYSLSFFDDQYPSLTVWIRPADPEKRGREETFTDFRLDGIVGFGVQSWGVHKKFYGQKDHGLPLVGQEFQTHWQKRYTETIAFTLAFIAEHSLPQ